MSPVSPSAAIVIVGGGIQGLSLAYNLALRGERSVVVLDAGYFEGGASGRNGTMIRGGFASVEWTALFSLAQRRWLELSRHLGHNVMYSRRGYLLLAEQAASAASFDTSLHVHAQFGIRSRRVSRAQLADLAPALAAGRVHDAVYLDDGGVAPHHAAMHAYRAACLARGVSLHYGVPVTGVDIQAGLARRIIGRDFEIVADAVVIAGGGQGPQIAQTAGLVLPGMPMRLEAMALEPVRPVLRPGLALLDRLCYLSQTARGEIVGGAETPERPSGSIASHLPTLAATARAYHDMLPCLRPLRILRHWAGLIHATPDFSPLIGAHPRCPNLWVTGGWAYGFASAPAVGELLAEAILSGRTDARLAPFALDRFDRGRPVHEGGIVLARAHGVAA